MKPDLLQEAIEEIKSKMNHVVTTASYQPKKGNLKTYRDGLAAKEALIRSETLIQRIHEITKISLHEELTKHQISHEIQPTIGSSSPELNVWGLLKKKKQDIVVLFKSAHPEKINDGPLKGQYDELGRKATKHAIVIGVRSQLSSVAKNFDTLMERAFAETVNLRLRHPYLVMGEVYLLAVKEYDEQQMKKNKIRWKNQFTMVEKFISIFNAISQRKDIKNIYEAYKYERSALILADFSANPVKIYKNIDELKNESVVSPDYKEDYSNLSPFGFSKCIIDSYLERHKR